MSENHISDAHEQLENQYNNVRLRELADELAGKDNATDKTQLYVAFLHQLSTAYSRLPSHIANTTAASHELLQRYRIHMSLLELLEDMVRIQPQRRINKGYAYSQVLCMYVFMRHEGKTRDTACTDLVAQIARSDHGFH